MDQNRKHRRKTGNLGGWHGKNQIKRREGDLFEKKKVPRKKKDEPL
jgi:hypothetical protein